MVEKNEYKWVDFYEEFADKLLEFKNERKKLIEIIIRVYEKININLPKLETDHIIIDIDPFTIFGLFNKGITTENRIKISSQFAKELNMKSDVPKSFQSIPVLMNINATYYRFKDERNKNDINLLWEFFEIALNYSNNPNKKNKTDFIKYFDLIIKLKGLGNSKVTMGLYWIAPKTFLNLDSRNAWYIYESGKVSDNVIEYLPKPELKLKGDTYLEITKEIKNYFNSDESKSKNFNELSFNAWEYSTEVNENKKKISREEKGSGLADKDVDIIHYWIYSAGPNSAKWDEFYEAGLMKMRKEELGDLSKYINKEEMRSKLQQLHNKETSFRNIVLGCWEFANEIKPKDVIFVKKGKDKIIGRGIVESDYLYDDESIDEFVHIREVNWTHKGEWDHPGLAVVKTLTDITSYTDYVDKLENLFDIEDGTEGEKTYPKYTKNDFLKEVFVDSERYDTLTNLLENKKNIILQGAPGVGKTYIAKRLAYSIIGEKDQERVKMVQFHQSYTYEDFIEGFRPSKEGSGFEIKKGAFYRFCKKAADDLDNDYFFIIDEINRGNLSKIFGELFMLIENDKRGNSLQLLYSDEMFFVPTNVYLIGMMNTADRGLAMLDYALRRRFAFVNLNPAFQSKGFLDYQKNHNNEEFDRLLNCIEEINKEIEEEEALGKGFSIGHSYFSNLNNVDSAVLNNIIEYEIIPLISEYWFDEPSRVREFSNKLRKSIK